ncbi:MAG: TatD family hydrolase [Myxococcota bacterium]|nr:TatD family hydrolase [Myxococcota bacterium]
MAADFVDFHCHLDLYPDLAELIAECERAGVFTLAVTTTPRAWPRNQELVAESQFVKSALGLHPQLVPARAAELSIWEGLLPAARYVGEVGLDAGPRFAESFDLQKRVFERVLCCCAEQGGKVLSVHSVRAVSAVLDLVERHLPQDRGRVVLHWFTGSAAEARRATDLGCYFSVNARMLAGERGRALVALLPASRLLTETDGPFIEKAGRPLRPTDVADTVKDLAAAVGRDAKATGELIRLNLGELLAFQ